jgi:hypothetical protein
LSLRRSDTNWFLDVSPGDEDAVWMIVREACIRSGGLVVDADPSSGTRKEQMAWGEDRLKFTASDTSASGGSIVVRNRLSVAAAWSLAGNGRNSAMMLGELLDVHGRCHKYQNTRSVSPTTTVTETTVENTWANQSYDTDVGASEDGASLGAQGGTIQTQGESCTRTVTSTTASDDTGHDLWELETAKTFSGTSCEVVIASAAALSLKAQALYEDNETQVEVTEFNLANVVDAAYVAPPPPPPPPPTGGSGGPMPGGPSTPDDGEPSGPTTPGGGEPSGPMTPDDDEESAPIESDEDGDGVPDEDELDDFPFIPPFCGTGIVSNPPGRAGRGDPGVPRASPVVC